MNNKGFTLIEMLVVIAVVGILAATVLTSIGPARSKAKDTRIQSALQQLRSLKEIAYNATSGNYDAISDDKWTEFENEIKNNDGSDEILGSENSIDQENYYYYSALASDKNKYYCVDSEGFAGVLDSEPSSGSSCE
jgi:prepilin-type N-terminal cleavage/methylation domain-containing protein